MSKNRFIDDDPFEFESKKVLDDLSSKSPALEAYLDGLDEPPENILEGLSYKSPFFKSYISDKSPAFKDYLRKRAAQNAPVVRPLTVPRTEPFAFFVKGQKNESKDTRRQMRSAAKGDHLSCTDTSSNPGFGTVVSAFVGPHVVFRDIPTWMFDTFGSEDEMKLAEAAAKLVGSKYETEEIRRAAKLVEMAKQKPSWVTAHAGMEIIFYVTFLEDCEWHGVLWSKTLG